jgi:hypothetical protein
MGYTLHVHTAGGGIGYTLACPYCWWWKDIHPSCLYCWQWKWIHPGHPNCFQWKGYTLDVHTACGGKDTPCMSILLPVKRNTPCTSILLVVEGGTLYMFILLAVEMYTPCRSILLVVERDTPYMSLDGYLYDVEKSYVMSNAEEKLVAHWHFYQQ